jgi:hypothetical protein
MVIGSCRSSLWNGWDVSGKCIPIAANHNGDQHTNRQTYAPLSIRGTHPFTVWGTESCLFWLVGFLGGMYETFYRGTVKVPRFSHHECKLLMLAIIYALPTICTSMFMMYFIHCILTNMLWLKHVGENIMNKIHHKQWMPFVSYLCIIDLINAGNMELILMLYYK